MWVKITVVTGVCFEALGLKYLHSMLSLIPRMTRYTSKSLSGPEGPLSQSGKTPR